MVSKTYLNKFYRQLLYVAQEIFGTYSLEFDTREEMAYYMDMPYTQTFNLALYEFNSLKKGIAKWYGSRVIIEVFPF